MAKHHDRHLATEQLSAFLDKQLSPEEQAICEAHLQSCQHCQNALLGLRQTVAFLQALPQPELPRSFALPTTVTYLQERPERQPAEDTAQTTRTSSNQAGRRRSRLSSIRRATRVVSTIAAVIGLIFLLSTVLSIAHLNGGASSTSTGSAPYTSAGGNAHISPTARVKGASPQTQAASPTVSKTPAIVPRPGQVQNQPQSSLALPDISTSLGRQEIGFILLALGIIGFLLTRRWRPKPRKQA